jgi:hypothetical protein
MPFFHCELTGLSKLSFSTADDPFFKTSAPKFYPEACVYDQQGIFLGRVSPSVQKNTDWGMSYIDGIRDAALKVNDDRKIQINLGGITQPGTVIILMVRKFDNTGNAKEGEFDRAWFRLSNEETNQTIDYSMVSKIDVPEDYQETIPNAEDEEAEPIKNELTYIHGILYLEACESGNKWVFESLKSAFQQKDHGDISSKIGEIYSRGINEAQEQAK